jgi:ATP-dependent DNA helicase DinG
MDIARQALDDLARVTTALEAAEDRPGQQEMTVLVAKAIESRRHLVVQAGTGTGKSAGYLVPAIRAATDSATGERRRVVVVTASKALQDQLATKDLPFIAEHLGLPFEWAVLKGRSNYLCLQRAHELGEQMSGAKRPAAGAQETLAAVGLDHLESVDDLPLPVRADIKKLITWSTRTRTGDQADLDWAPSERAWSELTVSSEECPGAKRCPIGERCFAESARLAAAEADLTVVNTFLYGLDVASGGAILHDHDIVIFDEAHQLEDVMSDTVGVSIGPGRFTRVAQAARKVLQDPAIPAALSESGSALMQALAPSLGQRLSNPLPTSIAEVLAEARLRLNDTNAALGAIKDSIESPSRSGGAGSGSLDDAKQRVLRAQTLILRLTEHIDHALAFGEQYVPFVSGGPESPRLEIAPLDVGPVLRESVWSKRTAILTSATIPASLIERVGLPAASTEAADVGSPFDYGSHALLYCAMHLPDPRNPAYSERLHEELAALIEAAGGRTLALFTSWKAMDAAAAYLTSRSPALPYRILTQRDLPKPALIRAFTDDPSACLLATSGFFQGVDIPGDTLTLVTIDRIPFPRPDDPLLSARREQLGAAAFRQIDIPRASMLLAQAAGRLIRTATDRGVVAVFDSRLGTANYRWDLVRALPPMRRTRHRAEAEEFLRSLRDAAGGG